MLDATGISVSFGGVDAVSDFSLHVAAGEAVGLIGANGAGKSTTINALSGLLPCRAGRLFLLDEELTRLSAQQRFAHGLTRTFQQAELVDGMTVRQNLLLPMRRLRRRHAERRLTEMTDTLGLGPHLERSAADLPYGLRRLVDVGRALMSRPKAVLLDEPAAGLTTEERTRLVPVLSSLGDAGVALVLVDHDVKFVTAICPRLVVLDAGRTIAQGAADSVIAQPAVIDAYLGKAAE